MPMIPHSELPAFRRLLGEGAKIGPAEQGLPRLDIGLLNLMPDAALAATDRQFIRLVAGYAAQANLYIHPFTLAADHRSTEAQKYVTDHYINFDDLTRRGLDALIITGANPTHFELSDEPYWPALTDVLDWGEASVQSILCSCLATHAVLEHRGLVKRSRLPEKRWGVYSHSVVALDHPLLEGLSAPIEAPHSHHFDVSRDEMEQVGLEVLVSSQEAGVHMAATATGFSYVFFQGHPEYDDISLLKEYKREVLRFQDGEREDYPPLPAHYFEGTSEELLAEYGTQVAAARAAATPYPAFPEDAVTRRWKPNWFVQGQVMYANWLADVARRAFP